MYAASTGLRSNAEARQRMLELQADVLRSVVTGAPTSTILALLCKETEVAFAGCTPTILVRDDSGTTLRVAAGDGLPDADRAALEALPVADTTVASGQIRTQTVDWSPNSELWSRHGVRPGRTRFASNWSTVLVGHDCTTLGVLVMFWPDHPEPSEPDRVTIQTLAELVVSVLMRHQFQQDGLALVTDERNRIAGELHDDSVQAITAVALRLQRLRGRLTDPEARTLATQALEGADEAIERMRNMLFELHPITLAEDGLVLTLKMYFEDQLQGHAVHWEVLGSESLRAPVQIEAMAFRLTREAITNALKHAAPTTMAVSVEHRPTLLVVTVEDDGRGFDVDATTPQPGHLGIRHVIALAASAGGDYRIESAVGLGSKVTISLPILLPSRAVSTD